MCNIPKGTVLTYTQAILDAELAIYEQQFDADFLAEVTTELQSLVGTELTLGAIAYIVNSTGDFTHDVTVDLSGVFPDATGTAKQQVKWNSDKSRVFTAFVATDGTNYSVSSFIDWNQTLGTISYQDVVLLDDTYKITFKAKVSPLNDGKNGVAIDSSWQDNDLTSGENYTYKNTGSINDEGGRLTSSSTYLDQTYYTEETFDDLGQRTGGLYCNSAGKDCTDKANWQTDTHYAAIEEGDPSFDDDDIFSSAYSVTGLPDEVEFFVVTESDVTEPSFEDAICFGSNFQSGDESYITVSCIDDDSANALLNNGANIFEEVFNESASDLEIDIAIPSFSYRAIPEASFIADTAD